MYKTAIIDKRLHSHTHQPHILHMSGSIQGTDYIPIHINHTHSTQVGFNSRYWLHSHTHQPHTFYTGRIQSKVLTTFPHTSTTHILHRSDSIQDTDYIATHINRTHSTQVGFNSRYWLHSHSHQRHTFYTGRIQSKVLTTFPHTSTTHILHRLDSIQGTDYIPTFYTGWIQFKILTTFPHTSTAHILHRWDSIQCTDYISTHINHTHSTQVGFNSMYWLHFHTHQPHTFYTGGIQFKVLTTFPHTSTTHSKQVGFNSRYWLHSHTHQLGTFYTGGIQFKVLTTFPHTSTTHILHRWDSIQDTDYIPTHINWAHSTQVGFNSMYWLHSHTHQPHILHRLGFKINCTHSTQVGFNSRYWLHSHTHQPHILHRTNSIQGTDYIPTHINFTFYTGRVQFKILTTLPLTIKNKNWKSKMTNREWH